MLQVLRVSAREWLLRINGIVAYLKTLDTVLEDVR